MENSADVLPGQSRHRADSSAANDKDGSVPWYRGIDALSPIYAVFGESRLAAGTTKRPRNPDPAQEPKGPFADAQATVLMTITQRRAHAVVWMSKGIPAIDKGKTYGFEPSTLFWLRGPSAWPASRW